MYPKQRETILPGGHAVGDLVAGMKAQGYNVIVGESPFMGERTRILEPPPSSAYYHQCWS